MDVKHLVYLLGAKTYAKLRAQTKITLWLGLNIPLQLISFHFSDPEFGTFSSVMLSSLSCGSVLQVKKGSGLCQSEPSLYPAVASMDLYTDIDTGPWLLHKAYVLYRFCARRGLFLLQLT